LNSNSYYEIYKSFEKGYISRMQNVHCEKRKKFSAHVLKHLEKH
jgi:hypothetical protein